MNIPDKVSKQLQAMSVWRRDIFKWSRGDSEKDKQYAADLQREPLLTLGNVDSTNAELKQLHSASMHGRKKEILEVLQKGIWVDFPNDAGQTPLFCATLRGFVGTVELLLQNGANPNEKSDTGMTPVHVACLQASIRSLCAMIEAGGDMRLHDNEGNSCLDWARLHPDPKKRMKMMEFIQKSQLFAFNYSGDFVHNSLDRQPSILQMLRGKVSSQMSLDFSQDTALRRVHSHGYGRVYYGGDSASGIVSIIPLLTEGSLSHDSEGLKFDSSCGFTMTGMLWGLTPITVKQPIKSRGDHHSGDLLISEVEHLSKLRHPNILLLMGLCQTKSFEKLMLVFERVNVGSLHYVLHRKIDHLPMTYIRDICSQVCQAMAYIHGQNYLHCGLTSHAVVMTSMHQAKVMDLQYMVEIKKTTTGRGCQVATSPHRDHVYRWMAPEVMLGCSPSTASDVYSFCCVLWEMLTSELPWKSKSVEELLEMHNSGSAQLPRPPKCVALFESILTEGLKNRKGRPRDFGVLMRWLQSPLDKEANWKPSPVDRLKSLQRESKERISLNSRVSTSINSANMPSGSATQDSSTFSEDDDASLFEMTQPNTSEVSSAIDKNMSRNRSENSRSSVPRQSKSADTSGSCSAAKNEAAFNVDAVDSPAHVSHKPESGTGQMGPQEPEKNSDSFTTQCGRAVSFSTARDLKISSRRAASLPWQRSLGALKADGSPAKASRQSAEYRVRADRSPLDRGKTLPMVKPASHLTDIKDFSKDGAVAGAAAAVTQAADFVPRRARRLSPRRSLPGSQKIPYFSPRAFPRSKSASGDVLEMDEKNVELSMPGSVRALTEQFQARLNHHTLRQSILRGSMTPHGMSEDLFSNFCLTESPPTSEVPPEGKKEVEEGNNVEDREALVVIMGGSSGGSSESLTSVSLQCESTTDEDHVSPLPTMNDLYIAEGSPVSKPCPSYLPLHTMGECQPAANNSFQARMFQGSSAFRKLSKQVAVDEDENDEKQDYPDTPHKAWEDSHEEKEEEEEDVMSQEIWRKSHNHEEEGQEEADSAAATPHKGWRKSQFLPSSLPGGTDISSHPFDFQDYYIDDDFSAVSSEDPSGRPLRARECEATHIASPACCRRTNKSRLWLGVGDNTKGPRQKGGEEQKKKDVDDDDDGEGNLRLVTVREKKGNKKAPEGQQKRWNISTKDDDESFPEQQKRSVMKKLSDLDMNEALVCSKLQYFEIFCPDEQLIPERDYNSDPIVKEKVEIDQDQTKDMEKTKEHRAALDETFVVEKNKLGETDWIREQFSNWGAERDATVTTVKGATYYNSALFPKWQTDTGKDRETRSLDESEKEYTSSWHTESEDTEKQRSTKPFSTWGADDHDARECQQQLEPEEDDHDAPTFTVRESRWDEFVKHNKMKSSNRFLTGIAETIPESAEEEEEEEENQERSKPDDETNGQDAEGPRSREEEAGFRDAEDARSNASADHPETEKAGEAPAGVAEEKDDGPLPSFSGRSTSSVAEKPLLALLPQPDSLSDNDDVDDEDDENDTTLVPEDVDQPSRCLVLNLERNTLSQEDIRVAKTTTPGTPTPPAPPPAPAQSQESTSSDKAGRRISPIASSTATPTPTNTTTTTTTTKIGVEEEEEEEEEDATGNTSIKRGPGQSKLRRFYLGSTQGSQGYSTTLRVESSLVNPGSHRIKQTATDAGSGETQVVHEETVQADTLRTTMTIQ